MVLKAEKEIQEEEEECKKRLQVLQKDSKKNDQKEESNYRWKIQRNEKKNEKRKNPIVAGKFKETKKRVIKKKNPIVAGKFKEMTKKEESSFVAGRWSVLIMQPHLGLV